MNLWPRNCDWTRPRSLRHLVRSAFTQKVMRLMWEILGVHEVLSAGISCQLIFQFLAVTRAF